MCVSSLTNVKGVIVTIEPEGGSLFWGGLILDDVGRCFVLGDGFGLGRTSNEFRKFFASYL